MIDLRLFPESEPGFSGSSDAGVSAPSSESSSASLPSFEPDRGETVSSQPQFQSPSGTAAPGGGGPPGGPPRPTPPGDPNASAIQSQYQRSEVSPKEEPSPRLLPIGNPSVMQQLVLVIKGCRPSRMMKQL